MDANLHNLIDLKILRQRVGDEEHRDLALQLIDGRAKVFRRCDIKTARSFIKY